MTGTNCGIEFGTATLAGVEFEILPSDHSGGRRILTHEYPFRDEHYNEDLGDKPRKWSIKGAFVDIGATQTQSTIRPFGANSLFQNRNQIQEVATGKSFRDKMMEAKAKWTVGGYFNFYEPTENETFQVVLVDWSFSLDSKKLNYVEFTLELVERGKEPYLDNQDNGDAIIVNGTKKYLDSVKKWWFPRFNLYSDIARVFTAYNAVGAYLSNLTRQFIGFGSFLGVTGAVAKVKPTRSQDANFDRLAETYEAVASSDNADQAIAYFRAATEIRITGSVEEEDQAHISALIALGYYFEAVAENASFAEMAMLRERATSLAVSVDDANISLAINAMMTMLGRSAAPPCLETLRGQYHALPLSYQVYGDISRAADIMALSGGVSGAAMNDVVFECQT